MLTDLPSSPQDGVLGCCSIAELDAAESASMLSVEGAPMCCEQLWAWEHCTAVLAGCGNACGILQLSAQVVFQHNFTM